jgi:hypothetical protein
MAGFIKKTINIFIGYAETEQSLGNIRKNISAIYDHLSNAKKVTRNEPDLAQAELLVRYRRARLTAFGLLTMLLWSFYCLLFSNNAQGIVTSSIAVFGVGIYYLALCRDLYKTRLVMSNWSKREMVNMTWPRFFNAIAENPKNLYPRKIKH